MVKTAALPVQHYPLDLTTQAILQYNSRKYVNYTVKLCTLNTISPRMRYTCINILYDIHALTSYSVVYWKPKI